VRADYSPLIHYLWQFDYMPRDAFLGTLQFGTETFHAVDEVLFRATNYSLAIARDDHLQWTGLKKPKTVSVPTQVPTVDSRFKSDGSRLMSLNLQLQLAAAVSVAPAVIWGVFFWLY
jgi:hypothetical protein